MATNGYQYNVGTNVNTSFDTSALNGYRAKQAMKNNWRGSFGSLDSQPAAQASPYSQMGVNNQFQKQGAPVIGESTQPLQAVQSQPIGGKAGAAISGAAGIAGSIVQDANAYNQLVGQDPSKMVDNTYYDPYQTNMRFNQVDNPYTRTTGSYVGENAGKYALQGASVGSAFGPWGCVCAGTKVITNLGEFKNIEELVKEDGIVGWDGEKYIQQSINAFQPPAKKECLEIETQLGHILKCSTDHPIYSSGKGRAKRQIIDGKRIRVKEYEYVDAEKLSIGDRVGLVDEVPIWGEKQMPHPYLIGLLIGDGSYGKNKPVRVNSIDKDTWEYLETSGVTIQSNYDWIKLGYNMEFREYRVIDGTILLRELDIYGQTNQEKRLPKNIHEYSKDSICKMIAGLIDSDGYVTFNKNKPKNGHIGFCQVSIELIKEVQNQLIKLGIHSSLRKNRAKTSIIRGRKVNSKEIYRLVIKDKLSICNFVKNIKLNISYKKENLINLYNYIITTKHKDNISMSKARVDRIIRITPIGLQDIYNLEADGSHTYIANIIITHNTLIGGAIGGIGGAIGGAVMGGEVEKKRNEFEASQARARQQFALMQQRNQAAQDKMQRNAQMNDYLTRLYSKRVNFDAL